MMVKTNFEVFFILLLVAFLAHNQAAAQRGCAGAGQSCTNRQCCSSLQCSGLFPSRFGVCQPLGCVQGGQKCAGVDRVRCCPGLECLGNGVAIYDGSGGDGSPNTGYCQGRCAGKGDLCFPDQPCCSNSQCNRQGDGLKRCS